MPAAGSAVQCSLRISISPSEVLALLAGRIARYGEPREVHFVTAPPRSANGEIKMQELRAALAAPVTA